MSVLVALVAIGAIGTALGGRRPILVPAVLTVVGIVEVGSSKSPVDATSVALLALSAVIAIAIGAGLGAMTRLERRDGHLWAQLPKRGLWLWGGLFVSRVVMAAIASVFRRTPRGRHRRDPAGARAQPCRPVAGRRSAGGRGRHPVRARKGRRGVRSELVLPLRLT